MTYQLSVLDQSIVSKGSSARDTLLNTIKLAQWAEQLGYFRFWVAEHHDNEQIAGSSPEILISHLINKTNRIRIGSGGVMLQHYSPFKVAENFNLLSTLAPGRIDLGVGRGPGGLSRSTAALKQGNGAVPDIADKLDDLRQLLHRPLQAGHALEGLKATPLPEIPAKLYVLGSSVASAVWAAQLGLPYVFSQIMSTDPNVTGQAFDAYYSGFNRAEGAEPESLLSISAVVADTDEEAKRLAGSYRLFKINFESGKAITVASREEAEKQGEDSGEDYKIIEFDAHGIAGSASTVRAHLHALQRQYGIGEFIISTLIDDFEAKWHSYELLMQSLYK